MSTQVSRHSSMSIPRNLKMVGIIGGIWALLTIGGATLAYLPGHPGFSIFNTYLSDLGASPDWPQKICEWLFILSPIIWMLAQSILLGRMDRDQTP